MSALTAPAAASPATRDASIAPAGGRAGRAATLTGLGFVLVLLVAALVGIGPQDPATSTPADLREHYVDERGARLAAITCLSLAATLLLVFGARLRQLVEAAQPRPGVLGPLLLAGATLYATALALDATLTVALVETTDDVDPAAVQALNALLANDFLVFGIGLQVLLLALGLAVLRTGLLPRAFGVLALVLAAVTFTPALFLGFIGGNLLLAVVSVVLARRTGRTA